MSGTSCRTAIQVCQYPKNVQFCILYLLPLVAIPVNQREWISLTTTLMSTIHYPSTSAMEKRTVMKISTNSISHTCECKQLKTQPVTCAYYIVCRRTGTYLNSLSLSLSVCVCVCMCVSTCTYMCVCVCVCLSLCKYIYALVFVRV